MAPNRPTSSGQPLAWQVPRQTTREGSPNGPIPHGSPSESRMESQVRSRQTRERLNPIEPPYHPLQNGGPHMTTAAFQPLDGPALCSPSYPPGSTWRDVAIRANSSAAPMRSRSQSQATEGNDADMLQLSVFRTIGDSISRHGDVVNSPTPSTRSHSQSQAPEVESFVVERSGMDMLQLSVFRTIGDSISRHGDVVDSTESLPMSPALPGLPPFVTLSPPQRQSTSPPEFTPGPESMTRAQPVPRLTSEDTVFVVLLKHHKLGFTGLQTTALANVFKSLDSATSAISTALKACEYAGRSVRVEHRKTFNGLHNGRHGLVSDEWTTLEGFSQLARSKYDEPNHSEILAVVLEMSVVGEIEQVMRSAGQRESYIRTTRLSEGDQVAPTIFGGGYTWH